ncbi:MAG: Exonuclease [Candidatus Falkowbacteria bacterium GW2011_GWC2_38_22]|uniref:Exonuclease n=1 Tax=Candidatus Falkowbacteria bacterium GW2011_GWE1_38_31 TaxID=1618638 RepID=A0A0G0MZD1_9BACT|nr:MAG: Exonuclease [Candidatus Falkowbacteria bacterium GW2011_GWF2_38_1205]KKQ61039.1 MAG: Exonuclease [Candidatus Falkowbacteria bacterium GW2011_GWC2_38_22]KKQ63432.1 MAG: Exonuclease [Candidatus Falkowbacteria bacterium GW2011_GWF1_38_22]KKQ65497.1 MAG: Exonuclease [Candidatus Falkowbacteria bacterium GW2011_GWE2_38_254]KKQ70196.1 MAG: Exonuclease [Candidatus Falkowbacteria bacterium GW2011_GWE1_38_31]KKQ72628.1 MAG: Exonuclease [Candidatus Falkowbacteria bacterium GW2011_GWD2_38_42]HAM8
MFILNNKYQKLVKLLHLDKPLVIFDIETTGQGISVDKIIKIAYIKIYVDGKIKKADFLIDPEMRINPEAIAVHGIRNRVVIGQPTFKDRSQEIWEIFYNCYYSGFNIMNFDLPILRREFARIGMDFDYDVKQIIDTKELFQYMEPRTISMAYSYYCNKEYSKERDALAQTEAATEILIKQLEKYAVARNRDFVNRVHQPKDNNNNDNTNKFYWVNGEPYFAFSKYINRPITEIVKKDLNFLLWLIESDYGDDTKNIIRQVLDTAGVDYKKGDGK